MEMEKILKELDTTPENEKEKLTQLAKKLNRLKNADRIHFVNKLVEHPLWLKNHYKLRPILFFDEEYAKFRDANRHDKR